MEGLCLPVFKLLQKTTSGKDNKREVSSAASAGKQEGWPDNRHPPAAHQLSFGWTARGLTPVPSPIFSFDRLAA